MENQIIMPRCSGCGTQPLPIMVHKLNPDSGYVWGVIACTVCGYVYNILPLTEAEPEIKIVSSSKPFHN